MADCTGTIIILCAKDTIEEKWIEKAIARLDSSKIKYLDLKNL